MNTNAAPAATFPRTYHPELADYLEKRVKVSPNGCWEYARAKEGCYGSVGPSRLAKKHGTQYAHRLAFLCALGFMPTDPYVIRHICGNKRCCRPNHLGAGTQSENRKDAIEKGEGGGARPGEEHHFARLTEDAVRAIRSSSGSNKALAGRYGVSPATISFVRRGLSWKHVV
jgi:hypothetical protein